MCTYWLWIVCTPVTMKKKEKEEKKSIKLVEENKSDAGYRTLYLCSGDYKR